MNRAYCVIDFRSVDDDERIIEGIATTPELALDGLVLETEGIEFKLPVPFLIHHDQKRPIGNVIQAKRTSEGIWVRVKLAPAGTADYIDEAWRTIKAGVVRGLSITWKTLKRVGNHVTKSIWLELSAVAVPADMNATILSVRSADEAILAALGKRERTSVVRINTNLPASGPTEGKAMKKLNDHIAALTAKRDANNKRIDEINDKAVQESRSRDAAELEETENLERENEALQRDIDDFEKRIAREKEALARAVPVETKTAATAERQAVQQRQGRIEVRSAVPAHISMARMVISMWHARNNHRAAAELCQKHWPDQPELALTLRAIVEAGDTSTSGWASQLVPAAQQLQQEFLDMYRAQTIIGRIPGVRNVPFNVAVPLRTAAGTFQWVGEAAPKPVTSETFDRVTLTWAKAAAIAVITQELARFSSPAAEGLVADSLRETIVRFLDSHFVSTTAEVSGVSPAGILNGISATGTTGTAPSNFRSDMFNMLNNFTANNVPLTGIVLIMSETQALALSMMVTDLGVPLYPTISASGGTLFGRPVIVSEAVGTKIIALKASDILIAQDPGAMISVSDQATLEMETAPAVGEQSPPSTQSVLKSMFQNNMLAIRCEQFITWKRARTAAVEYINGNAYIPS